jgi:hypothetical protein
MLLSWKLCLHFEFITMKKSSQGNFILYVEELRRREAQTQITTLQHSTEELKYGEFQCALDPSSLRGNF